MIILDFLRTSAFVWFGGLEEKTKAKDLKFSKSRHVVDVHGTDVDADFESLNEEGLAEISGECLDLEIADAELDELKKVEDFQEVEDVRKFRISCTLIFG